MVSLVQKAKAYFLKRGIRFTKPRQQILAVIDSSDKPLGAYDIIEEISKTDIKPKPATIYRATEFLTEHGFIHKIESLNAFVACREDHAHKSTQFIICTACERVEEAHICSTPKLLQEESQKRKFQLSHWHAELYGICAECA